MQVYRICMKWAWTYLEMPVKTFDFLFEIVESYKNGKNTMCWVNFFTWMLPGTQHHPWGGSNPRSILHSHWSPRLHLHPPAWRWRKGKRKRERARLRQRISVNVKNVNKSQWKLRNSVTLTDLCQMFTKSAPLLQNVALQQSRESDCISLRQHQGVIMIPKWKTDGY